MFLADVVKVLVVPPGEHDVVEATSRTVDAILGAIDLMIIVGVAFEGVGVDYTLIKGTSLG